MVDSALSNLLDEDDFPVHFLVEISSTVAQLESSRTFDFGLRLGKI